MDGLLARAAGVLVTGGRTRDTDAVGRRLLVREIVETAVAAEPRRSAARHRILVWSAHIRAGWWSGDRVAPLAARGIVRDAEHRQPARRGCPQASVAADPRGVFALDVGTADAARTGASVIQARRPLACGRRGDRFARAGVGGAPVGRGVRGGIGAGGCRGNRVRFARAVCVRVTEGRHKQRRDVYIGRIDGWKCDHGRPTRRRSAGRGAEYEQARGEARPGRDGHRSGAHASTVAPHHLPPPVSAPPPSVAESTLVSVTAWRAGVRTVCRRLLGQGRDDRSLGHRVFARGEPGSSRGTVCLDRR
jgi:hypothetical protein